MPLHRVAILRPFVQYMTDIGTPVEDGILQAGLPVYALEDMNNYIPSQRYWSFLVNMVHTQQIGDLGFHVGQRFGANCLDPHLTELLNRSPTLYKGLLQAADLNNKTIFNSYMWLLRPKSDAQAYICYSPSCNSNCPAIEQIGWFAVTILISMIRMFAGPHWQPAEVGLVTGRKPGRYIREQLWDTHIHLQQRYCYIAVDNALLSLPPSIHDIHKPLPLDYEPLPKNFIGSLEQVLQAYMEEDGMDIESTAALCNMSKRSLQRKLEKLGTRYSAVLDRARFHVAARLLRDPDTKVTDIAHRLTYSDLSHFSRSFHRISGVSPCEYRQLHAT